MLWFRSFVDCSYLIISYRLIFTLCVLFVPRLRPLVPSVVWFYPICMRFDRWGHRVIDTRIDLTFSNIVLFFVGWCLITDLILFVTHVDYIILIY